MARIDLPPGDGTPNARMWELVPEQGAAYRAFAEVLYGRTTIPPREREIARMCIAMINDCRVCRSFRVPGLERKGVDEEMYAAVADWRHADGFTVRERLAAEYAERFALDHLAFDDEFWARMRAAYTDAEIVDLSLMVGSWLAFGRMTAVLHLDRDEESLAPSG